MKLSIASSLAAAAVLALTLSGCPGPQPPAPPAADPGPSPAAESTPDAESTPAVDTAAPAATEAVYPVACGCTLEAVGHCGEYAEVDGAFVEITGLDLGSMPFCGKSGLSAKIAGSVQDGTLVATSLTVVE